MKNIPFISLNSLSQGLMAGDSLGSSSSLRTEESGMTKNMAEITIFGQSLIDNRLAQSRIFRQGELN